MPARRGARSTSPILALWPIRLGRGDAEAAGMAAVAGAQFSVVSGGVLCVLGLLIAVRLVPELLAYEHADTNPA